MKNDYLSPIVPGAYYHLYNRTNNKEALFLSEDNRLYFLQQYRYYFGSFTDTYAYCLLDNHFHLFVRVKALDEFVNSMQTGNSEILTRHQKTLLRDDSFDELLHLQFRRFFTSYSMAFNTMWNRNGNLFHRPFKRVLIEDEAQYSRLVFYIHNNPVKHGLISDFRTWKWSSYQAYLSNASTSIKKEDMLSWFGGVDGFTRFHMQAETELDKTLIIED